MGTKIEWTDFTWNIVTGCSPCSPGCDHCYARRMAQRLAGRYGYPRDEPFRVTFHPDKLTDPLKWRKPRRVFVCSMADLFHEDVRFEWLEDVFAMMWSDLHTFIVLTKRPRTAKMFLDPNLRSDVFKHWPFPNVWLGVTVCNQAEADEKIPILLQIPAAVRWVSIEPMLEPIDLLDQWIKEPANQIDYWQRAGYENPNPSKARPLSWVVLGGETGPGARPMELQWARDVLAQCRAAGVPFFMKQIDSKKSPIPDDLMVREYPNGK